LRAAPVPVSDHCSFNRDDGPALHVAHPAPHPERRIHDGVVRPERASPGEGYPVAHTLEQNRILRTALDLSVPVTLYPTKMPGER